MGDLKDKLTRKAHDVKETVEEAADSVREGVRPHVQDIDVTDKGAGSGVATETHHEPKKTVRIERIEKRVETEQREV
jgi:hypothetical protein